MSFALISLSFLAFLCRHCAYTTYLLSEILDTALAHIDAHPAHVRDMGMEAAMTQNDTLPTLSAVRAMSDAVRRVWIALEANIKSRRGGQ